MDEYLFQKFVQMKHQKFCVYPDEEPDALRKQSFDGSTLTSSNSLRADCNSASVSGDKPALHEDTYCFEHDWFGDEGDAADMIGRVCHR